MTRPAEEHQEQSLARRFSDLFGQGEPPDVFAFLNSLAATSARETTDVILVDQDGVIVSTMARGPNLRSLLQELLGEPAPAADQTSDAATADAEVAPASFEEETAPAAVPVPAHRRPAA